jgi:hypothetical protein
MLLIMLHPLSDKTLDDQSDDNDGGYAYYAGEYQLQRFGFVHAHLPFSGNYRHRQRPLQEETAICNLLSFLTQKHFILTFFCLTKRK